MKYLVAVVVGPNSEGVPENWIEETVQYVGDFEIAPHFTPRPTQLLSQFVGNPLASIMSAHEVNQRRAETESAFIASVRGQRILARKERQRWLPYVDQWEQRKVEEGFQVQGIGFFNLDDQTLNAVERYSTIRNQPDAIFPMYISKKNKKNKAILNNANEVRKLETELLKRRVELHSKAAEFRDRLEDAETPAQIQAIVQEMENFQ